MTVAIDIKDLIEAGVHFGHKASRWHPSMEPYIYGTHNSIHIVDLRETVRGLIRASHFLSRLVEAGHEVVFVGTKPQAREVIRHQAGRAGMHFVVNRWLGGTLTNFNTIRSRLRRLEELEGFESDGSINLRKKKEISRLRRERRKIHRNLEGIRRMTKLPGAAVIVDVRRDHIAVAECKLLGIPVIAICDTDTDPAIPDLVIPGNDDAYRSIEILLTRIADAVIVGRDKLVARQEAEEKIRLADAEKARREAAKAKAAAEAKKADVPKPAPGLKPAGQGPKPAPGNRPAGQGPKPAPGNRPAGQGPKPAAPAPAPKPAAPAPAAPKSPPAAAGDSAAPAQPAG